MFSVKFDTSAMLRQARALQGARDQVPFALSLALNRAVTNARQTLIEKTWPESVIVRNSSFLRSTLRIRYATKANLKAEVYDAKAVVDLALHDTGGAKLPHHAHFAIPITVQRGTRGVARGDRPRAIISKTPARALRVTTKGIFVGQGGHLTVVYALRTSTPQPADVPFTKDFETTVRETVRTSFADAMARAMRTRR